MSKIMLPTETAYTSIYHSIIVTTCMCSSRPVSEILLRQEIFKVLNLVLNKFKFYMNFKY